MEKKTIKASANIHDEIMDRLGKLKITVTGILDSEYRYGLLILMARINECLQEPTYDNLAILQVVAEDLNWIYTKYGKTEETIDYIYFETTELEQLFYENEKKTGS